MSYEIDLNALYIPNADGDDEPLRDYSSASKGGDIEVVFRNLENELIRRIESADVVVGCVAWLTSEPILSALAKVKGVAIVVQKEDFLRPDIGNNPDWSRKLRKLYKALPGTLCRYDKGLGKTQLYLLSSSSDPTIESVRCVGNNNADKVPAFPRAHHKFVVFCRALNSLHDNDNFNYEPYEVWTGSFNFTKNAVRSFENAIICRDQVIVNAFFNEFAQIEAISEPLDWESIWVEPEWRIGT
jgi:hypothetical protein